MLKRFSSKDGLGGPLSGNVILIEKELGRPCTIVHSGEKENIQKGTKISNSLTIQLVVLDI